MKTLKRLATIIHVIVDLKKCLFQLERHFEKALKEKRGFIIKKMGEDGACLFRAVGMSTLAADYYNVILHVLP
jgi:hypothetical protein